MSVFIQCTTPLNEDILDGICKDKMYPVVNKVRIDSDSEVDENGVLKLGCYYTKTADLMSGLLQMIKEDGYIQLGNLQIMGSTVQAVWSDK